LRRPVPQQVGFLSAEKPRVHNRPSAATESLKQRTVRRDRVAGIGDFQWSVATNEIVLHVNNE
jgi:hypothetical protein